MEKSYKTLAKVDKVFKSNGIKYSVCGGLAVNKYGFLRSTADVDVIVDSPNEAKKALAVSGFKPYKDLEAVLDRDNKVRVDILKAGCTVCSSNCVLFPKPHKQGGYVTIEQLISLKLDSARSKDFGDVGELIKVNKLPRNLKVNMAVAHRYKRIWDAEAGFIEMIEAYQFCVRPEKLKAKKLLESLI